MKKYIPDGHEPYAKSINEIYVKANEEFLIPVPSVKLSRFEQFNTMTGGLRPYEFSILCGGTGTGKTTLCANISRDLVEQKVPHFVASVETGSTDYVKRIMSAMAGCDWNTGEAIAVEHLKQFHAKHGEVFQGDSMWLSLYDNRVKVETLMADLAFMSAKRGAKIAIIDNLNFFMEVTSAKESIVEMDRVIHELIIFCKQVPIHVLMVMHPKKTEHGRVESEYDIKGSSTAVQEAHNVFLFNRPHQDLIAAQTCAESDREIKIAKMRRMGKYVGHKLVLNSCDGVSYREGVIL